MYRICGFVMLLFLCSCGGGGGGNSYDIGPGGSDPDMSDVSVYVTDSPYVEVLKDCVLAADVASLCSMETLPLIGYDSPDPTVADVMDRVLVSHAWMAVRFEEALNQLPADMLALFKGLTGIVIDSEIRPSYYSRHNAVIHLDPAFLWLTNAEKATISQAEDYRSDFGNDLQFVDLWRYVKDSDYASTYYPLDGPETRVINDIIYRLSRLLYHELAHANDFLPPALQSTLDRQLTPYAAVVALEDEFVATRLDQFSPLTSTEWYGLGQVLFRGEIATIAQKSYTASLVGSYFEDDVASETYSYSSIHEDVAMLFEEAMMKYHFDVDRDIAFTDRPLSADPGCDDYLVQWGVRNRLGEATVKPRAEWVVGELLPESDLSVFFAGFPEPTSMSNDQGWCENLTLGVPVPLEIFAAKAMAVSEIHPDQIKRDMRPPE